MSDERFNRLEEKVDAVNEKLAETNQHLAVYNEQLKIHIQGTEDNRTDIKVLRAELEPIKQHVTTLNLIGRMAVKVFAAIGAIATLVQVFLEIKKYLG